MPRQHAPFEIPREIVVRGKRWVVAYDIELGDDKHDARSRSALGRGGHIRGVTYPENHPYLAREIHLSAISNAQPRDACSTFLHEAIHACSDEVIPAGMEERFIRDIELPLLKVLEQLDWRKKK